MRHFAQSLIRPDVRFPDPEVDGVRRGQSVDLADEGELDVRETLGRLHGREVYPGSSRSAEVRRCHNPTIAPVLLGLASFLALVALDVRADAAFDAPKRLVAMLGITVACVAALMQGSWVFAWRDTTRRQRLLLGLAGGVLLLACVSSAASPRPAVALDSLRAIAVFAMVACLCGAAAVSDRTWRALANAFLAGALLNAVLSLAQAAGTRPLQYATTGGRADVSALIGNTGILAIVLACAAALVVARILDAPTRGLRIAWGLALVTLLAAVAVNRSATAFVSIAAVLVVFVVRHARRGRVAWLAAGVVVMAGAIAATMAARSIPGVTTVNRLLSYRIGPWAAAGEMMMDRPWLGFGPGTYAAEYAQHFVDAEARWRLRLGHPQLPGSYAQAHNDYFQSVAELGIPAVLAAVAALVLVTVFAWRNGSTAGDTAVLAVIVAGAAAALTWFPMQRPETAMLLLGALGRAWRIGR
jgi:putative inorganic carbon (HCO3(-)) transporter